VSTVAAPRPATQRVERADAVVVGAGPGGSEGDPTLYVEFKKDGGSIDPEPWWAKSPNNTVLGEKVRG